MDAPDAHRVASASLGTLDGLRLRPRREVLWGAGEDPGETWEWDGNDWKHIVTGGPPFAAAPMIFDSTRNVCVLVDVAVAGRLWERNGQQWTPFLPQGRVPPRRQFQAVSYDSHRQRIVMFGGRDQFRTYADTWEFGLYPDCDQSTGAGTLDIFDFLCFGNKFEQADPYACNCDTTTGNDVCDIFDFFCFQNLFEQCQP